MGKILDLSVFEEETLDVKLSGDNVIHLKKPTQGLVIAMLRLRNMAENTPDEVALATMNIIAAKILSNNTDGIVFTQESVAALSIKTKHMLLSGYSEFAAEVQANPTVSSPRSPEAETKKARRSCFGPFARWWNTQD
jgi:hypothetical protein